jgi:hypothetical protein
VSKHISSQITLDSNVLSLCLASAKGFLNLDLTHPWAFKLLKKTQNEEDMVVKTLLEFLIFLTRNLG